MHIDPHHLNVKNKILTETFNLKENIKKYT